MRTALTYFVALLTVASCGGGSSASPAASPSAKAVNTCVTAKASPHLAYLVVQHLSGAALERCAGFDSDTITADQVMKATGIQYQTTAGSTGTVVCQIDREPAQFTTCSADQPHWSMWVESNGTWAASAASYDQLQLHAGDGLGWRFVTSGADQPPPLPRPM